ncbi:hypothetical protein ACH5RR_036157 [Cinchona calisaya]|uniref:Uncharacterized protein n=1 Tax=Cinchona calisaya TaxID=153742 RepID=A0ABD2Y7V7_9GENT
MKMRKIRISHADPDATGSSSSDEDCQENKANKILKQPKLVVHEITIHDHRLPRKKIRRRVRNVQKSRKRFINGILRRRNSRKCSASRIKNFIKKVRFSLASDDDNIYYEVAKKPAFGQECNQELLFESPFVLQQLEGNAKIMGRTEEFGMGREVLPVASGVVVRGEFLQFTRGVVVNSGYPYYLPIVDNHGFLLGEFSKLVDDLSICDTEYEGIPQFE